jgi:hypothetical protein
MELIWFLHLKFRKFLRFSKKNYDKPANFLIIFIKTQLKIY